MVDRAVVASRKRTGQGVGSLLRVGIVAEYIYGALGVLLGAGSIVGGVVLGLRGVTGTTSWTAKVLGLSSQVNDAGPGVVLFILGLFMVWVTRPKVSLKDLRDGP